MRLLCLALLSLSALCGQDTRFKADLLLVVAHPDDESLIGSYLARAIFDEHRRVAVVFGTRGGSGGNAQGSQQSEALQDEREVEARRALAHWGVSNVWFLRGLDTPGQDVLRSLENWNHGDQLGRLVRIVRLTRPLVIATWLPDVLEGENHGDHQAASVLATEAFDMAGDPTMFPEQVAVPRDPNGMDNLLEGLRPWQPEKLYFFSDTSHPETLNGKGPTYRASEISPSKNASYARLAAEEGAEHLTQGDSGKFAAEALKKGGSLGYFDNPVRLVFGKSYVSGGGEADVFTGVEPGGIAYRAAPGFHTGAGEKPGLQFGGPWLFYDRFWLAHGLDQLAALVKPELLLNFGNPVVVPVAVVNPSDAALDVRIHVRLPEGWIYWRNPPEHVHVGPHDEAAFTFTARTPDKTSDVTGAVVVEGEGLQPIRLQVAISRNAMPQ